ncbi:MAG: tetratricopeptide repeat protein, partial [Longimicrobiales bacterium]|nr:tetratricopeptide repeat protein [Longimicrobiales bacterium]
MNARFSLLACLAMLVLFAAPVGGQQTPEELLQSALYKQQVEGDLEGAVEILQTLIDDFAEHREIAASALVLLGRVHETLGSANAERAYQRVLNDYPDQRAAVAEARTRLAALTRPPPITTASTIQLRLLMAGVTGTAGGPYPDG